MSSNREIKLCPKLAQVGADDFNKTDPIREASKSGLGFSKANFFTSTNMADPANDPNNTPKVPKGFKAVFDDTYKTWFYVDVATKKSQWEPPAGTSFGEVETPPSGPPPPPSYSRTNSKESSGHSSAHKGSANDFVPQQQYYPQQPMYGQPYPQQPMYGQPYPQQPMYGQPYAQQPMQYQQQQQQRSRMGGAAPMLGGMALGTMGGMMVGGMMANQYHEDVNEAAAQQNDYGGGDYGGGDFGGGDF